MTIASDIKSKLDAGSWTSLTLYSGSASNILTGEHAEFEPGHQLKETRNKRRVTYSKYQYSDGSKLEYRYIAVSGSWSLREVKS